MIGNFLMRIASFSYQKTMVFGLILAAGYFFFGYNNGSEIEGKLASLNTKFQEEKKREQQSDASLKEVELVRATVGELGQQYQTISNALPRTIEYAEVTRIIDYIARKSGVSIKSRESRPEINRDYYSEVPIKVSISGSYSEIVYFLSLLAQTVRVMKVVDFSINAGASSPLPPGKVLFEGEIISYKFNAKTEKVSDGPAGGKN